MDTQERILVELINGTVREFSTMRAALLYIWDKDCTLVKEVRKGDSIVRIGDDVWK